MSRNYGCHEGPGGIRFQQVVPSTNSSSSTHLSLLSRNDREDNRAQPVTRNVTADSGHQSGPGLAVASTSQRRDDLRQQDKHALSNDDLATLRLAIDFKCKIRPKIASGREITEKDVEAAVVDARKGDSFSKYYHCLDVKSWRHYLPSEVQNCDESIILASMAYENDPTQAGHFCDIKMRQPAENPDLNADPMETSVKKIAKPLSDLNRQLSGSEKFNLGQTIRKIAEDDIERADRMFYSEIHRLCPSLDGYTFENAHDAVQAICIMNYDFESNNEILPVVKTCRNFDEVYEYLRRLAKKGCRKQSSPPTTTTNAAGSSGSFHRPPSSVGRQEPGISNDNLSNYPNQRGYPDQVSGQYGNSNTQTGRPGSSRGQLGGTAASNDYRTNPR